MLVFACWIGNLMCSLLQNRHHTELGLLFRSQRYITPETILYLNKATIRPCMEYCSYSWGGAPRSGCLNFLDRVQRSLVNLIGPVLLSTLQSLSHRRVVATLSLFYKYWSLHQYAVDIPRCKRNFYKTTFFHALQGFGILSLQTAFHQNTIFMYLSAELTGFCSETTVV